MINLEMPHINLLSKIDLMKEYGRPNMPLDFYFDTEELSSYWIFDEENMVNSDDENKEEKI